jgi:uncharacterized protein YjbI with pentapeptide repeats
VDLSGASLSGANLSGANLSRADLSRAYLYGANLYGAYLYRASLYGAYLYGSNLIEAIFSRADLSGADLSEADFYGADLYGADLSGAALGKANLIEANLCGANLSGANLSQTKLIGAVLSRADFSGTDLSGADLSAAIVENSTFGDIDLRETRGLETVKHLGPSTIGIDTIYRSRGKISKVFLQKAGLPEDLINYIERIETSFPYTLTQIDDWLDNLRKRLAVIMKNIARLEEEKAVSGLENMRLKIQNELDECWMDRENVQDQIIEFQQLKNDLY